MLKTIFKGFCFFKMGKLKYVITYLKIQNKITNRVFFTSHECVFKKVTRWEVHGVIVDLNVVIFGLIVVYFG